MKKHLLLILALLAFVLPARAATDLLFNFTQNSTDSDYGTNFDTSVNSITISSNADVYIKSVGIYIEAEDTPTPEKCATPVFSPASGTFGAGKEITVTCSTPGATITVVGGLDNNESFTLTSGQTFKLPNKENTYNYAASATATGYTESETADASYIVDWPACAEPVFSPAGGTVAPGTVVTLTCATAGAEITYYPADNEDDFNLVESGHTFPLPTTPGTYTYKAFADASATFYGQSEIVTATYTVTAPVHNEVAPKISFSPEDQKVFGSEDEINVTLSLNEDVYPVPNVIYYTLDGFMAHNTLETGTPGATPAGHVLEAAVNPSTLSGTVRIERSHREALNHRAVTINAYTFNTAGNDVAAATYIFNDNAAPLPDPEPTTITATVTMANQGWTSGPYSASSKNATWTSDEIVALDNATLSFETSVTISVNSNYPTYYTKTPAGLRIYGTSYNKITIKAPTGYAFKSVKPTFEGKNSPKFYLGDFSDETNRVEMTSGQEYTLTNSASSIMLSANAGQIGLGSVVFVLEKTAAKAAVAPTTIKTATGDVYNLVTDASQIKTGDQLIIASHYYKTGKSADDNHYVLKSVSTKGTGVKNTSLNSDNSTLAESSDCLVFTVEVDGTKDNNPAFLLKNGNNYLSGKNDGNGLSLASKANISYCTITNGESGWGDNAMNVYFYNCGTGGNLMCYTGTTFNAYKSTSCSERSATNDQYSNVILYRKSTGGPTVEAPVISLSERSNTTEAVTVTINCATVGATVTYTVTKDGNTVADNLTYDPANKPVFSEVGSYTVNATASKEGMNPANATPANFTIEKLVEVVEELFFVMDQNLWDVDGAYPETVVPFEYKGNNTYDLDITKIPAKGWYMNKDGIWTAIEHGFRGNFYVRDGKANHKGLVFGATGTVADATFATRAAAAGNQMVEPHTKYNMYVVNEGKTHKVFTTIDDNSSKAFTDGTIRVTHTPGNKDAAKTMTLEILAEDNQTTGVDSITAEDAASDADARFFNLQGVEVPADRLAPGIYIRQAGSKATKVLVK